MSAARVYAWERIDEEVGHSIARIARTGDGWSFSAAEILAGLTRLACAFEVNVDERWHTRTVTVSAFDEVGTRQLKLASDGDGRWMINGEDAPHLTGATDVDIAATPLTNTFPLRRLADLPVGDEQVLAVAWVEVPDLRVERVRQTYRRLPDIDGCAAWEYRDDAHGAFRLTVDDDGVVVEYQGFARRISAP